ncbi:unnamed protein product [Symbiodinium microadriaticum]|nr:unnamed protein product [Symbiodinium microadriaticum]
MADRDGKETRGTDLQPAPGLRALRVRRLSGEPVCELRVPVSWSDARQQIKEIPRAMQQLLEARKCNSYGSWSSEVAQLRSALAESLPEREQRLIFEGEKWSLERLHLCFAPPQFPLIHFDFANDALDEEARQSLESVAEILRRHPGLGLLVRGYARPEAPPDLGIALSQARAARVRSHLLGLLGPGRWQEDATEGLRQGGYSEGDPDLDRVLEFYRPRVVGRRIRAVGCWSETDMVSRRAGLGGGQSAEIFVDGFQESRELKSNDCLGELSRTDEAIELPKCIGQGDTLDGLSRFSEFMQLKKPGGLLCRRPGLNVSRRLPTSCEKLLKRSAPTERLFCAAWMPYGGAVSQRGDLLRVASEALQADEEVVLAALRWDAQVLAFAAPALLENRSFALRAVACDGRSLESLAVFERRIQRRPRGQYGFMLEHAGDVLRADKQVVLATVRQTGIALQFASEEMCADRDVVMEAVRQNGLALEFACEKLRADRELDGLALALASAALRGDREEFAAEELQADRDLVLAAVRTSGMALSFAAAPLRCEIVLIAVAQNGNMLEQAALPLRGDKEVVLSALRSAGRALLYAAVDLKAGVDVLLQLLECHGSVLSCCTLSDEDVQSLARHNIERTLAEGAVELREDAEVLMAMVKQHSNILAFASPGMRAHKELVLCAVRQNGLALKMAAEELRNNAEVAVCAAVAQNGLALELFAWFASDALRADRKTVKCALHQDGQARRGDYLAAVQEDSANTMAAGLAVGVVGQSTDGHGAAKRFAAHGPAMPFAEGDLASFLPRRHGVQRQKVEKDARPLQAHLLKSRKEADPKDVVTFEVSKDTEVSDEHAEELTRPRSKCPPRSESKMSAKAIAVTNADHDELEEGEVSDTGMTDSGPPCVSIAAEAEGEVSDASDSDGEVFEAVEDSKDLEEGEVAELEETASAPALEPGEVEEAEAEESDPTEPEESEEEGNEGSQSGEEGKEGSTKQLAEESGEVTETEAAAAAESSSDGECEEAAQGSMPSKSEQAKDRGLHPPNELLCESPASRRRSPKARNTSRRHAKRPRSPSWRGSRVRVANRKRLPRRSEWAGTRIELGLSPRHRSSSSRSRRRTRSRKRDSRPVRPNLRQGQSKWDVRPDPTNPDQKPLKRLVDPTANGKKRRELYVGNLPQHKVDEPMLRQAFNRLFLSLPSFVERYPDIVDVVRSLYFPPKGEGMFAFVEFVDDVLTTTAMQMSGFELQNRSIRIGRPQSYEPPHDGELAGLDVQPLREKGLLPAAPPGEGKEAKEGVANVLREVYFGNLATGMVDEEVMRELLQPAAVEVPEFDPDLGPAICKVTIPQPGNYCFVLFQSAAVATRMISIFDETELFGRKIRVGRPSKYAVTVNEAHGQLSLPPLPPPSTSVVPPPAPSAVPLAPHLLKAANAELVAELASCR